MRMRDLGSIVAVSSAALALIVASSCGHSTVSGDAATTGTNTPTPTPTGNSGTHITTNTTWTGTVTLTGNTTIDPGVTVTTDAGTTVSVPPASWIYIQGTLTVNGTAGSHVTFNSTSPGTNWNGFRVQASAAGTIKFVDMVDALNGVYVEPGAGLTKWIGLTLDSVTSPLNVSADTKFCHLDIKGVSGPSTFGGGTITLTDSTFETSQAGDTTSINGTATLNIDHQAMTGAGVHCQLHANGSTPVFNVTNSIFTAGNYAFDVTGLTGSVHSSVISNAAPSGSAGPVWVHAGNTSVVDATGNFWNIAGCSNANADVPTAGACCPNRTAGSETIPVGWTTHACLTTAPAAAGPRALNTTGCDTDATF